MPNDAKLGLVVGVGLVIAVAVLFFRKETPAGGPAGEPAPAGIVRPMPPSPLPSGPARTAFGPPDGADERTGRADRRPSPHRPRGRHAVQPGPAVLRRRGAVRPHLPGQPRRAAEPDPLPVGAELVIPELPRGTESVKRRERLPSSRS